MILGKKKDGPSLPNFDSTFQFCPSNSKPNLNDNKGHLQAQPTTTFKSFFNFLSVASVSLAVVKIRRISNVPAKVRRQSGGGA